MWTSGYCHRPDCCGWAYLIQYETEEGIFNVSHADYDRGSTTHQMSLRAIWQAIKKINDLPDRMTDYIRIYSNNERAIRCITGEYDGCRARVIASYLDEIGWAIGNLKIAFVWIGDCSHMKENDIVNKMSMNIK